MNRNKILVLFKYVLSSYTKMLIRLIPFFLVLFAVLKIFDIYPMLDLKYDSVLISMPKYISLFLAAVLLIFGIILYCYKYRRSVPKTDFYLAMKKIFEDK